MKIRTIRIALFALLFVGQSAVAQAALHSRLGGLAYYDDVLDVTWAANAIAGGQDSWANANASLAVLDIGGVVGWRLPDVDVNDDGTIVDCSTLPPNCSDNEFGHLYWVQGVTAVAPTPFTNVNNIAYWSVEDAGAGNAWSFNMASGVQGGFPGGASFQAWPVRDGDVGAPPAVPVLGGIGSALLMGLLGVLGASRLRSYDELRTVRAKTTRPAR